MMSADPLFDTVQIGRWAEHVGIAPLMAMRWSWPVAEVLHFVGICLLFGTVGVLDLRLLGLGRGLSMQRLLALVPWGAAGFALCVATGLCFVLSMPGQYLYNPAFQIKLAFMAAAGCNTVAFYLISAKTIRSSAADALAPSHARAIAFVSLFCWLAVITCGRVITAFRPPQHWCAWCSP
ncbi:MAG: hypothetical protein QM696_03415 [Steroidobacteraceae bacterium]